MSESDVTKPLNTWDQDSFLPEDYVKSKGERRANMLSLTLFGVMMLAVVAAFFATNRRWMSVRNEQRSVNAMYVREAEKIEELKELEKQRAEMVTKAEVTAALVERVPRSVLFAELVSRMPVDLTLTEFELNSEEIKRSRSSSRSGGVRTLSGKTSKSKKSKKAEEEAESSIYIPEYNQKLRIVGVGLSNDDIADYIENLRQCDLLDSVELKFIKESKIDGVLLRSFELSAAIRKGADARGLVEETAPIEMPDVRTPERLMPQMPLILPPSVDEGAETGAEEGTEGTGGFEIEVLEEGDASFEEAGEDAVSFEIPSLPSVSLFGSSESKWGSPEGLFDLMGTAARKAERIRSEKAALEIQNTPVVDDEADVAPAEESADESAQELTPEAETDTADESAEVEAPETNLWFQDPAPAAGDPEDSDEGETSDDEEPVVESDENEEEEPAPAEGDEGDDEKEDE
ncbi:MAG: hypothetical protein ED559_12305 [Phycisphaera sp.]|nr:MAG: hypothetical protein ED559_12305 [Phycisphaera sp.]